MGSTIRYQQHAKVWKGIVRGVASGALTVGTTMPLRRMVEILGISSEQVRETLMVYDHEGLLVQHSRQQVVIRGIDSRELHELMCFSSAVLILAVNEFLSDTNVVRRDGHKDELAIVLKNAMASRSSTVVRWIDVDSLLQAEIDIQLAVCKAGRCSVGANVIRSWGLRRRLHYASNPSWWPPTRLVALRHADRDFIDTVITLEGRQPNLARGRKAVENYFHRLRALDPD